jgi:hypothetical protein
VGSLFPVARVADNSPPRQFLFREPSVGFHSPLPGLADNGRPRRPNGKPRVGSSADNVPRRPLVRKPRVSPPSLTARVADNGHPRRSLLSSCSSKASPPTSYPSCRTLPVISALPTRYFKHLSVFIGEFMQCLTSSAYLGQTATLHQTVRCLWLLARLIQRPDFALPLC